MQSSFILIYVALELLGPLQRKSIQRNIPKRSPSVYLHRYMIEFLIKVWGPQNKLLKAVLDDANNELYISGCRALGLIDKFITGPLWKILESSLHILDTSTYFTKLLEFLAE